MFANATPTRPSESKSLYFSKDFVVKSDSEKNGILSLITVYGSPLYSGIEFILKVWVVLFIVGVDGLDEQLERNKDRDKIKDKIIERKDFIEKESSLKIQF